MRYDMTPKEMELLAGFVRAEAERYELDCQIDADSKAVIVYACGEVLPIYAHNICLSVREWRSWLEDEDMYESEYEQKDFEAFGDEVVEYVIKDMGELM